MIVLALLRRDLNDMLGVLGEYLWRTLDELRRRRCMSLIRQRKIGHVEQFIRYGVNGAMNVTAVTYAA